MGGLQPACAANITHVFDSIAYLLSGLFLASEGTINGFLHFQLLLQWSKRITPHVPVAPTTMRFCFSQWWITILNTQLLLRVTSASSFLFHLPLTLCGNCRGGRQEFGFKRIHHKETQRSAVTCGPLCVCVCVCGHLAVTCPHPPDRMQGNEDERRVQPCHGGTAYHTQPGDHAHNVKRKTLTWGYTYTHLDARVGIRLVLKVRFDSLGKICSLF